MAKKNNDPRANPPQPAEPDRVEDNIDDIEIVEGSSKKLPHPIAPQHSEDVLEDIEIVEGSSKKLPQPVEPLADEDVLEDVEVVEGSSKKLPPAAAGDILDDVEIVPGSSKKLPRSVDSMYAEEVNEDALDVEVVGGSSQKLSRPIQDISEDALDVEVVEGSSKKLPMPIEEIPSEILDVVAIEGSSLKLTQPIQEADEDVLDAELVEGSSRKMALPTEEMAGDILAAEVLEGSSAKLAAPVEEVGEEVMEVEVLEGSSKKLAMPVEEIASDIVDAEVVGGSSAKLAAPVEEVDEDVLDVEVVEGSSKKLAMPVEEIVSEIIEEVEEVEEKRPTGPLMPKTPAAKAPLLSPDNSDESKKPGAKPTALGPKKPASTRIGHKGTLPTMLAGQQEPDDLAESELGGQPPPSGVGLGAGPQEVDILDEEILVEGSSEVDLGKKSGQAVVPLSGDQGADALGSGVDLATDSSVTMPAKKPRSSEVIIDTLQPDVDSSAVDLGSSGTMPAMPESLSGDVLDVSEEVVDEGADALDAMEDDEVLVTPRTKTTGKTRAAEDVDEDEDLVVPKAKTKAKVGKSKVVVEEEEEELFVAPGKKNRAKAGARVAVTVGADEDEETPARGRGAKAKPQPRRSLVGAFFGGLLWLLFFLAFVIVVAAVGIWYARPDLLKEIPASPGDPNAKNVNRMRWQAIPKPEPNLAQEAQELRLKGDLKGALAKVENAKTPEEHAARAQIRWDLVRAQKPEKLEKINKEDPKVKEVLKDLKSANNLFLADQIDNYLLTLKKLRDKAVAATEEKDKLLALGKKLEDINTQLKDANVKEKDAAAGVALLLKEKTSLEQEKKDLATAVKALEKDKDGLATTVKTLEKDKNGLTNSVKALEKDNGELKQNLNKATLMAQTPLTSYLGQMAKSLGGLGGGMTGLFQQGLDKTSLEAKLKLAAVRDALHETPEQRLDNWIALLQNRDRQDPADLSGVTKHAEWVATKDANANAETKAKALLALGLVQRNHGNFAEAKKSLEEADRIAAKAKAAPVAALVKTTLNQLTDPEAYYLPLARHQFEEGKTVTALKTLDTGLQAMPENPRLLVARGLMRLESIPAGAKLPDEAKQLVRQDADKASKDAKVAPEALFVLGRLEERLGQFDKAEANYRQALAQAPDQDRYRAALAKLLQQARPAPMGGAEEKAGAEENQTSRNTPAPAESAAQLVADTRMLLVLSLTCVQPPGGDDEKEDLDREKRLQESIKLAKELLKSLNAKTRGEGHMILGQAYLKQSKRNEAVLEYVKGLELFYPGTPTADLVKMVQDHPAFQQLDSQSQVNPQLAQRYFGKGLEYFWAKDYPQAEKEFQLATSFFDGDARYHYYLGLARYQQKNKRKQEAAKFDFATGARLEAASRPDSVRINASLERVQGPLRQILGDYRQKAVAGAN